MTLVELKKIVANHTICASDEEAILTAVGHFIKNQHSGNAPVSSSAHVMRGTLVTYSAFTHSDRNHLTIEVWNNHNYVGNNLKPGDELEVHCY